MEYTTVEMTKLAQHLNLAAMMARPRGGSNPER